MTIGTPVDSNVFSTSSVVFSSSPAVISSSNRTSGSNDRAIASEARCTSPPESVDQGRSKAEADSPHFAAISSGYRPNRSRFCERNERTSSKNSLGVPSSVVRSCDTQDT
mmetsp:Transcript_6126/g.11179  ORF Transcript_6126/g.11179 Transcript_6126/m.11179 type:complete len:110 (+) Transcript_6126:76-405(+)